MSSAAGSSVRLQVAPFEKLDPGRGARSRGPCRAPHRSQARGARARDHARFRAVGSCSRTFNAREAIEGDALVRLHDRPVRDGGRSRAPPRLRAPLASLGRARRRPKEPLEPLRAQVPARLLEARRSGAVRRAASSSASRAVPAGCSATSSPTRARFAQGALTVSTRRCPAPTGETEPAASLFELFGGVTRPSSSRNV